MNNTLTLTLEGPVTLADYVQALSRLERLLAAMAEEVAPGVPIRWVVQSPTAPAPGEEETP